MPMKPLFKIAVTLFIASITFFMTNSAQANSRVVHIVIQTEMGDIEADLYPEKAPITVANFLANMARGTYKGGQFYRSVDSRHTPSQPGRIFSVIQGGKAESIDDTPPFAHEPTTKSGLLNDVGTLSMARLDPGTASSEFFINLEHNKVLDSSETDNKPGYAVFGQITKGLGIVKQIQASPTGNRVLTPKEQEMIKKTPEVAKWLIPQLMDKSVLIKNIVVR